MVSTSGAATLTRSTVHCHHEGVGIDRANSDPSAERSTTSDVAAYLGLRVSTVSSDRMRGQMPEPDMTLGRTHAWRPSKIIEWHQQRPRPGVGGWPVADSTLLAGQKADRVELPRPSGRPPSPAPTPRSASSVARAAGSASTSSTATTPCGGGSRNYAPSKPAARPGNLRPRPRTTTTSCTSSLSSSARNETRGGPRSANASSNSPSRTANRSGSAGSCSGTAPMAVGRHGRMKSIYQPSQRPSASKNWLTLTAIETYLLLPFFTFYSRYHRLV